MKIAIPNEKGMVCQHFGQSESFEIYTIEEQIPVLVDSLKSPEHKHGSLPMFLKNADIDIVICGGIGQGAVELMTQAGMDVISGVEGYILEVVKQYANHELVSKNVLCHGHNHDHDHDHECHHD